MRRGQGNVGRGHDSDGQGTREGVQGHAAGVALSDLVGPAGVLECVRSVGGAIVQSRRVAWSSRSHLCPVVGEAGGTEVGDDTWAPLQQRLPSGDGVLACWRVGSGGSGSKRSREACGCEQRAGWLARLAA